MNVIIAVTRPCHHCQILERELKAMDVEYEVKYLENNPEIVERFKIRSSPNVIVDDVLVFKKMPELRDLRGYFKSRATLEFFESCGKKGLTKRSEEGA